MRGYQNDDGSFAPLGTSAYRTGDVAARSTDGYYTYIGRADDVFKASDYRISPFELESALIEHPAVAEAAVVPAPDAIRLAVPKAYVTLTASSIAGSRDRAVDLSASARDAGAVQARAPAGVRRSAEDDLRQDPACGVAPAGGGAGEAGSARRWGVSRGGFPGAACCVEPVAKRVAPIGGTNGVGSTNRRSTFQVSRAIGLSKSRWPNEPA